MLLNINVSILSYKISRTCFYVRSKGCFAMSPERCTLFGDVGMTTSDLQCITASTHVGSLAFVSITMNEIKDKTSAEKVMLCPWCCLVWRRRPFYALAIFGRRCQKLRARKRVGYARLGVAIISHHLTKFINSTSNGHYGARLCVCSRRRSRLLAKGIGEKFITC